MQLDRSKGQDRNNEQASLKPDQETLHTTDPQEEMKGPLSSLMHETGDDFDTDETQREADQNKLKTNKLFQ